jgi:ABC-type uncharacterized transport system involved in gliding motility auxiliary subunit
MKKYSYVPGFALLAAGCLHAAIQLQWGEVDVILAAIGAGIVLVSVGLNWHAVREWFGDPRGIFALNTAFSFAILLAILVLVNFVARTRPVEVDLTSSGRNTLGDGTRQFLGKLTRDVGLRQFGRAHSPQIDQLLTAFSSATPRIRMDFVDVDRQRKDAIAYGITRPNGTIVVSVAQTAKDGRQSSIRFRKVDQVNEAALVTAMLQVLSDKQSTICFTTGHGEHGLLDEAGSGLSRLAGALEVSNFRLVRPSLLAGDVPADCSAVVVAGPQQDLQREELTRLHTYLLEGGRVALMLDPSSPPGIASLASSWGIVAQPGTVFDTSGAGQAVGGGPESVLIEAYGGHPITSGLVATMFGRARPLAAAPSEHGGQPRILAQTGSRSFVKAGADMMPLQFDPQADRRGPITVAMATEAGIPAAVHAAARRSDRPRLVVFGDSDFAGNGYLRYGGNRDLFLRAISWLVGEREATVVNVSDRENRRVAISQATKQVMFIVNLVVLPLIPMVVGIVIVIRAKR